MAINLTADKRDLERRIRSYVSKKRSVPVELLQHYSYLVQITGSSNIITADNG